MQLNEELKDTIRRTDNQVYVHTRSHLEQVCWEKQDRWNVGLKAFILEYNNISHIMIQKGVFAEYSQVKMLLEALRRDLSAQVLMELDLDPREPLILKDSQL